MDFCVTCGRFLCVSLTIRELSNQIRFACDNVSGQLASEISRTRPKIFRRWRPPPAAHVLELVELVASHRQGGCVTDPFRDTWSARSLSYAPFILAMDHAIGLTADPPSKSLLCPLGRADLSPLRPQCSVTGAPRRAKRSPASSPSSFFIVTLWLDARPPPWKKWGSDHLSEPAFTPGQPGPP